MTTILTIGHSVAPAERFVELLREAGIETLVDVRSVPYSRRVPHTNREILKDTIERSGLNYVYLGDKIGGKTDDPQLQTPDGKTDYNAVRRSGRFREGIDKLIELASVNTTAIMCAEENPARCHRAALIAPMLVQLGCHVLHLRHDGSQITQADLEYQRSGGQLDLF